MNFKILNKTLLFILLLFIVFPICAKEDKIVITTKTWQIEIYNGYQLNFDKKVDKYKNEFLELKEFDAIKQKLVKLANSHGFFDYNIIPDYKNKIIYFSLDKPYKIIEQNFTLNEQNISYTAKKAEFLITEDILEIENDYRKWLIDNYCLYDLKTQTSANIDKNLKNVIVNFSATAIKKAVIGEVKIKNDNKIDQNFIKKKLDLKTGQCYKKPKIDNSRINLLKTNIFDSVFIKENIDKNHNVNLDIKPVLAKNKMISAGFDYDNERNIKATFGWRDRNFNKMGQVLSVQGEYSAKESNANIKYHIPYFSKNTKLTNSLKFLTEKYLQYDDKTFEAELAFAYQLNKRNIINYGIELKNIKEKDRLIRQAKINNIFSLPLQYIYFRHKENSNIEGYKLNFLVNPKIATNMRKYLKTEFTATNISKVSTENLYITNKFSIGKIFNDSYKIANNEKYLLGGKNDIRGYKYKNLGIIKDNKITAANSYIYLKNEALYMFKEDWAAGVFYDVGQVNILKLNKLVNSVGITTKYFINKLPIGVDFAVPLNKRKQKFAIYLSMGWPI